MMWRAVRGIQWDSGGKKKGRWVQDRSLGGKMVRLFRV